MSVAVISLRPLDETEIRALAGWIASERGDAGEPLIAAPADPLPARSTMGARLGTGFRMSTGAAGMRLLPWHAVLAQLAGYDRVWAHQYLAADFIFDLVASVASDQYLLLTSGGDEGVRDLFATIHHPCPRHIVLDLPSPVSLGSGAVRTRIAEQLRCA